MYDVITPLQSCLINAARGVEVFTSDASIARFLALEPTFEVTGLKDTYSPRDELDKFGRFEIQETISEMKSKSPKVPSVVDAPSSSKASPSFIVPKPGKRRSHLISDQELAESAERLIANLNNP